MPDILAAIYVLGGIITIPIALVMLLRYHIKDSYGEFGMLLMGVIISFLATPLLAVGWPICFVAVSIYGAQKFPDWLDDRRDRRKLKQRQELIENPKLEPDPTASLKPEDRAFLESHGWIGPRSTGTLTVAEAQARFGYINPAFAATLKPCAGLVIPKGYPGWGEYRITGNVTPDGKLVEWPWCNCDAYPDGGHPISRGRCNRPAPVQPISTEGIAAANEWVKKRSEPCHAHDELCLNCPSDFHRTGCTTPGCWDRAVKERSQRLDWSY